MDQMHRHLAEAADAVVASAPELWAQLLPAAVALQQASTAVDRARSRAQEAQGRALSGMCGGTAGQPQGAVAAAPDGPPALLLPTGPGLVIDELACELWAHGDGGGGGGTAATGPGSACGNPLCTGGAGGGPPKRLQVCGGCRAVAYCSRACAQAMWPRAHRFSCARLAARRAALGGSTPVAEAEQQGQGAAPSELALRVAG
jgi:hypothetical protein